MTNNDEGPATLATVSLDVVVTDPMAQSRRWWYDHVVSEYAQDMADGVVFEPVAAVFDGSTYWVWDGHHRVDAVRSLGLTEIVVSWRPGTRRDAIRLSLSANARHGQPRTAEDKRHAVTRALLDPEWGTWSDAAIARLCVVSDRFVAKMRRELSPNGSGIAGPELPREVTVKRGGKEYTIKLPERSKPEPAKPAGPVVGNVLVGDLARNLAGPEGLPRPVPVKSAEQRRAEDRVIAATMKTVTQAALSPFEVRDWIHDAAKAASRLTQKLGGLSPEQKAAAFALWSEGSGLDWRTEMVRHDRESLAAALAALNELLDEYEASQRPGVRRVK